MPLQSRPGGIVLQYVVDGYSTTQVKSMLSFFIAT